MKVRIVEGLDHKWRFQFIAGNNEPQDLSEPYASDSNAMRGAEDLARNIGGDPDDLDYDVVPLLPGA